MYSGICCSLNFSCSWRREKNLSTVEFRLESRLLQADQEDPSKGFVDDAVDGDASVVVESIHSPFYLLVVKILASLMSCGAAPSCQHWQMIPLLVWGVA